MKKFFVFLMFLGVSGVSSAEPSDTLIQALIKVESKCNDGALGDIHLKQKAHGCLQIRQPVCDDVNRRFGTACRAEDCLGNRELSIWLCKKYTSMYATAERIGRVPTDEDVARIWNGGPNGYRRKSTEAYWAKVKKSLK